MELHQTGPGGALICAQEKNIEAITRSIERMEQGQERVVQLLERVVDQGARIVHLEEGQNRTDRNFEEAFDRIGDLEIINATTGPDGIRGVLDKLEKATRFIELATSKPALWAGGIATALIVSGALMDIIYHGDKFAAIWKLITGG